MKIKTKAILKYSLMPQLMPRINSLVTSGFSYVAFFMAQTYRSVQLLPADHPYLIPANMGRFGIRHVLTEAGNNLVFKKENIDQITIFALMFLGMILLAAQLCMLLMTGFVEVAHAGGLYPSSSPLDFFTYFQTDDVTHDVAFVLLDRVFGIPGVDGGANTSFFTDAAGTGYTCVVQGIPCFDIGQSSRVMTADNVIYTDYARGATEVLNFPWPYHEALRGMVQVYSIGLLVIGVFIFLYFVFVLAAETTQTGTAFGKRFNHIWAPVRIVVAMGLLVPIAFGLNPAQWLLMYAAKWGSSFANNGWRIYTEAMTAEDTLLGAAETLVATPESPPVNTLMEFGSILATCKLAYERMYHERPGRPQVEINAWLVNTEDVSLAPAQLIATAFPQAMDYFNGGTIVVRFGELREDGGGHQTWDGRVAPLCGEVMLDITYNPENFYAGAGGMTEPGSWRMLRIYYELIQLLWNGASGAGPGVSSVNNIATIDFFDIGESMVNRHISYFNDAAAPLPTTQELASLRGAYTQYVLTNIALAVTDQQASPEWLEDLLQLGWGGAAIWYNKIAQLNGGLVSAVHSMPTVKKYPFIMEENRKKRASSDSGVSGANRHQVYRGTDDQLPMEDDEEEEIAKALYETQIIWRDSYSSQPTQGSAFVDAINAVFGTEGLFNMSDPANQNVHPLALLASIGRTIVESSIRNLGFSAAAGLGGGLANMFQGYQIGSFAGAASSFFFQVGMIGLSIGFVLFYIIPFLPFIYFFFAVGGWVKAIFEAMVGVPLWALAHIRIDGNGLPGDAAMGGYYLILEIFLRPILIIFGFIASITIFTAQVQILNEIWYLVVSNASGFSVVDSAGIATEQTGSITYLRGAVDEFFFSVMYAILCYMLAMASFKLIDQIPNHILRWMGASVSTFGDQSGDPAQNLVRNSFIGSSMISNPLKQAAGGAAQAGKAGGAAVGEIFGRGSGR